MSTGCFTLIHSLMMNETGATLVCWCDCLLLMFERCKREKERLWGIRQNDRLCLNVHSVLPNAWESKTKWVRVQKREHMSLKLEIFAYCRESYQDIILIKKSLRKIQFSVTFARDRNVALALLYRSLCTCNKWHLARVTLDQVQEIQKGLVPILS